VIGSSLSHETWSARRRRACAVRGSPRIFNDIKENAPMSRIRSGLTAVALAAVMGAGAAFAQAPASPPATKSAPATKPAPAATAQDTSKSSTSTQVKTWTTKQWEAAKKEWAKDKTKWAACQKQSSDQKLTGRKSWSFLYTCMAS
jgi:hypothetical protein